MQIGRISPVLPTPTVNKTVVQPITAPKPAQEQQKPATKPPPVDPGPPIRPTLQDRIDVNRTLRLLRQV